MEELKTIYEIVLAIWKLIKKYGCRRLSDQQWDSIRDESQELGKQFRQRGEDFYQLFHDLYVAVRNYYKRKEPGHEKENHYQR